MRKALAILLLAIHCFNVIGYRLYFSIAEDSADARMVSRLNNNRYLDAELTKVSIPLHVPYLQNSNGYERYDGEIEHNGVQYNYVKRMVKDDTLFLYCIPNQQKNELTATKHLYAKQSPDNTGGKKHEVNSKKFLPDGAAPRDLNDGKLSIQNTFAFDFRNDVATSTGFITNDLQPPDLFI